MLTELRALLVDVWTPGSGRVVQGGGREGERGGERGRKEEKEERTHGEVETERNIKGSSEENGTKGDRCGRAPTLSSGNSGAA